MTIAAPHVVHAIFEIVDGGWWVRHQQAAYHQQYCMADLFSS